MLMVNRHGRRVVDEKAPYNERGQVHFTWDAQRCEYPNLLLFWIFDQAVVDDPTESRFRWPVPLPGEPFPDFVVSAERLEDLGDELARRLARLADHTGGVTLADGFVPELRRTIARFGEHARAGDDPDFGRGRSRISQAWAGAPRAGFPNPTLAALAAAGPFHCVILGPGALDTKGGPATDEHGRVLSVAGEPIPGLYGAGNCIASPAGQAYWGPGGTIGPAVVFGAIAAEHALTR
jgi:hypothetical protein